ncbi:MAG: BREX-3 system phosphatase PglZ [Candidatus Tenebribacter davisii]|nr:BREX-3 system phosphatase PglZ [Candidatus Tenebribacter davisii]
MSNFVNSIINKIRYLPFQLIFIIDKDNIFKYPEISEKFDELAYRISDYQKAICFRIEYELEVKPFLLKFPESKYLVRCSSNPILLEDIGNRSDIVMIGFHDLFPYLDNECLRDIPIDELDRLLSLSENLFIKKNKDQTISFLLEKLYLIDLDSLNSQEAFIARMLNIHSRQLELNPSSKNLLRDYANKYLPKDKELFSKKIFDVWIKRLWVNYVINEDDKIDFIHPQLFDSLRLYFINHNIEPCEVSKDRWAEIRLREGVYYDHEEQKRLEVKSILKKLEIDLSNSLSDTNWNEMIRFMSIAYNNILNSRDILDKDYYSIEEKLNQKFQSYLVSNYKGLTSKSPFRKPYTMSQILSFIHYQSSIDSKQAVIVIDGLNYWQWYSIEQVLNQESDFEISTDICFSFIPSITSLSRQAIFKGDKPDIDFNQNPKNEENNWKQFWISKGFSVSDTKYFKIDYETKCDDLHFGNSRFLAFVTNDIDDMMHSVKRGNKGLYDSTMSWINESCFVKLLSKLKKNGYSIFIGSDHGSIEAKGWRNLKVNEKFGTSRSRSRRHLEYANRSLLNKFLIQNPELVDYLVIENNMAYLKNKLAFALNGQRIVTHGGSHFWEVLTPFVRIK